MSVTILKGDILFSKNKKTIETHPNSYLVAVNGICKEIYTELPQEYRHFPVEDYSGKLIVPGLVDLHIHAPQYAFRGMNMDAELMEWLNTETFPEEAKYGDLSYAKKAYTIFTEQMKKSATTRAVIFATQHRESTELLMDLMEQTGMVSYVGKVNMDMEAPENLVEESAEVSARETLEWISHVGEKFERTKPILTPRFIPCCSRKLLDKLREIRLTYDLPVQSHLSENPGEIAFVQSLFPDTSCYGECYDRYDLFGKGPGSPYTANTVMAHCVYSSDAEIDLMERNRVFIAHCPASNLNLSSGIAPIRKYIDRNLLVGLGSDVAGGQSESIFRAMTDAIQVSKMYWRYIDPSRKSLTFEEAFYLGTKGGGKFFGLVGGFEEGYHFDALVLDDSNLPHPQELTPRQRLERFAYLGGDFGGILAKYVDGTKIF